MVVGLFLKSDMIWCIGFVSGSVRYLVMVLWQAFLRASSIGRMFV